MPERVAARPSLSGWEQRFLRLALAFFEPCAQDRDGLGCEGRGARLRPLPVNLRCAPVPRCHVADGEA